MSASDSRHDDPHTPEPDDLLRVLVEAVEAETGDRFFQSLVRHLAAALEVQYAFVSELTRDRTHFRTLALWERGRLGENIEVPIRGTPCESVLRGEKSFVPDRLQERFPEDVGLAAWSAQSYAGVPLLDRAGAVVGHFAIIDDRARADSDRALDVMRIFAARAVAEIERQRADAERRASEERLAQIIDCATDAILSFDEQGAIRLFNAAAERVLRCRAADAIGTPVERFTSDDGLAALQLARERLRDDPGAILFIGETEGVRARRADGSLFVQEASLSRSESRGEVLYTVIFRDVEERRSAARELADLQRQNDYLREEIRSLHNFEEIVGRSAALARILEQVERVAATDAAVLLHGETGTGKELIARAVHARSARRARPLVKLNCAALSAGVVESELFGHERGAFTGATERRLGRFEIANGGTLFLDEIGELPLETQAKLLRVLQEGEFERVGGSATLRTDVRVIAATNRDLEVAVGEGRFREDLFYRLNVFPIALPALRERLEDIPLLVRFFVERHAGRIGRPVPRVSRAAMDLLQRYPWPGNVRELENVVERAVILSSGPELALRPELLALDGGLDGIELDPAPAEVARDPTPRGVTPHGVADEQSLSSVEREHIVATLRQTSWRIDGEQGAARRLGLNPSTLRSRMKKLGIKRSDSSIG